MASMAAELAELARASKLDFVARLLDMVRVACGGGSRPSSAPVGSEPQATRALAAARVRSDALPCL